MTQPRLGGIAAGIANVLVGRPAIPATENRLFQALTILSFAIIGVQAFGIFSTTIRLRRWRRQPERRPVGALSLAWHLGLPLALNLGWGAAVLLGFPLLFGMSLFETVFLLGDFAYLIVGSAAVALVWGLLRTLLAWRALNLTTSASASGSPKASAAVSLGNA